MSLGAKIRKYREEAKMSSGALAKRMHVSEETVQAWEADQSEPKIGELVPLAKTLHTTVGRLLEENRLPDVERRHRLYNEEHMYTYAKTMASALKLSGTVRALAFAREKHQGQMRKGEQSDVPYINHPLTMVCEAFSMGLHDDDILSALLLHDVVEDCRVTVEELPANDAVKEIVRLVTKDPNPADPKTAKEKYYAAIRNNPKASFVKCIDRQNNLANMALGFTRNKMADYVAETENYIVPLLRRLKDYAPEYANAVWLIGYHIYSLLETYKRLL